MTDFIIKALRDAKLATEMSDDLAFTNGSLAKHDAEIARFLAMESDGERLLAYQERCGKLTAEDQRSGFEVGMIVKIYDPSNERHPWNFGKIVRKFQPVDMGVTIEDNRGIRWSAPYGDRIRLVGYPNAHSTKIVTERRGLYCGDLFAPIA